MKSFIAKRVNSILVNLRYLRFKLLKYTENNKKICNSLDHDFKNIPLYIMKKISLERYYIVLYNGALTLKMSKMALNPICDKTLHIILPNIFSSHTYLILLHHLQYFWSQRTLLQCPENVWKSNLLCQPVKDVINRNFEWLLCNNLLKVSTTMTFNSLTHIN